MKITKEELLMLIKDLPDEFSVDEILDKIIFFQKVKIGLSQSENNIIRSTELLGNILKIGFHEISLLHVPKLIPSSS